MQHPDEGVIHTWLDGELPADEAAALEAHIAECSDCAAAVAEARGLIAASSRIVSALDIVPGDVIPVSAPRKRAWYANTQLRAAAAVLIVAGASLVVMRRERAPEMAGIMNQTTSAPAVSAPVASDLLGVAVDSAIQPTNAENGAARRDTRESVMSAPAEQRAANRAFAQNGPTAQMKTGTARKQDTQPMQPLVEPTAGPMDAARSSDELERKALVGKVAGARASAPAPIAAAAAVAPAAPAAPAAPPALADLQQRSLSRLRDTTTRLDEVVVTGVATSSAKANDLSGEAKLRQIKSDTTESVISTTYAVSANVMVTLVEVSPRSFAPQRAEADQMKKEKAATGNSNVIAGPVPAGPLAKIETITWTNPITGRVYTLSGPLSKDQLTALRKRLPPGKQ